MVIKSQKSNKRTERNKNRRKSLWPEVTRQMIWDWKKNGGFATVPRTLPYFLKIMDELSKGKPVSNTYLALWCRLWDESGVLEIRNPDELAIESGFSGQRAILTWRTRMKILIDLGFIKIKPLRLEEFGYILILNPYYVVNELKKKGILKNEGLYNAFIERAEAVKAEEVVNDDLLGN